MQKSELIRKVTEETGLPLSTVESVLNTTFLTIAESVASGEKVTITGFGTFADSLVGYLEHFRRKTVLFKRFRQ